MRKFYKVKTTHIDYCVEEEDICETFEEMHPEVEVDSDEYWEAIDTEINRLKNNLPQTLELEIECEEEDLDDEVGEAISEETGWLVNGFTYNIIEEN